MPEPDDIELLRQYSEEGSEEAFAALTARHVNLVYSAAVRKTGNPTAAEEVTQAVFIILAKKAGSLKQGTILSGWLYQTVRLTAANYLRTEIRRVRREQEALMQTLSNETEADVWRQMTPQLEDAMGRLGEKDRNALVLRFFERKNFQEVGAAFGVSENAAKKHVKRALDKLRKCLARRGVLLTTAAISGAIAANAVHAAPAELAISIGTTAAQGSAAAASTLTLAKGAMKLMTWAKIKTAAWVGVTGVVAATATTVVVSQVVAQTGGPPAHSSANPPVLAANSTAVVANSSAIAADPSAPVANPPALAANPSAIAADLSNIDDSVWEGPVDLAALPPVIIVRPTHFAAPDGPVVGGTFSRGSSRGEMITTVGYGSSSSASISGRYMMIAKALPFAKLIIAAYGGQGQTGGFVLGGRSTQADGGGFQSQPRLNERSLALPPDAVSNRYDVLMTVPNGSPALLAQAVKDQLGYAADYQDVETNVLLLTMRQPGAPGLKTVWDGPPNVAPTHRDFPAGSNAGGFATVSVGSRGGAGLVGPGGVMTGGHLRGGSVFRGADGQIHTNTIIIESQHPGYYYVEFTNQPISRLVTSLDTYRWVGDPAIHQDEHSKESDPLVFPPPILDRTGLTGNYDVLVEWTPVPTWRQRRTPSKRPC